MQGIRPITGLEITIAEDDGTRSHLTLIAETRRGYSNLCRLSSIAFGIRETIAKEKQARRLDPYITPDVLRGHAEGVIVLTGCLQSRFCRRLVEELAAVLEHGGPGALAPGPAIEAKQ